MRKRSKSVHTSVPFSLEIEEKPEVASDDEFEVADLDQTNAYSGAEDTDSDGECSTVIACDRFQWFNFDIFRDANRMEQWRWTRIG